MKISEENKELLLKDLCARLPYNVIVRCYFDDGEGEEVLDTNDIADLLYNEENSEFPMYKPYLRPISSMTEEECVELSKIRPFDDEVEAWKYIKTPVPLKIANIKHFDFFHSHHLD